MQHMGGEGMRYDAMAYRRAALRRIGFILPPKFDGEIKLYSTGSPIIAHGVKREPLKLVNEAAKQRTKA